MGGTAKRPLGAPLEVARTRGAGMMGGAEANLISFPRVGKVVRARGKVISKINMALVHTTLIFRPPAAEAPAPAQSYKVLPAF